MILHEVVIIGAGPAGIATAMQLKRCGISPLLLEKERVGGLLWNANLVENYPGFPKGVTGPELARIFERQIRRIGVAATEGEVVQLDVEDGFLVVRTTKRESYYAGVVVVASGTKPKPIPQRVLPEATERIYTEVYPLLNEKGRQIVIIGAGDAAFDYALNLARKNSVTILNRGRDIRCLPLLWARARACGNIAYRDMITLVRAQALEAGGRLMIECACGQAREILPADYLVFATGREPQRAFLSTVSHRQERELVDGGRLYFAGDVINGPFRQTAIAIGDGLRVAMQINKNFRSESSA